MKTEKLNLKSIKNALSRGEMKKIMAGSGNCTPLNGLCGYGNPFPPPCCGGLICTNFTWEGTGYVGTCMY